MEFIERILPYLRRAYEMGKSYNPPNHYLFEGRVYEETGEVRQLRPDDIYWHDCDIKKCQVNHTVRRAGPAWSHPPDGRCYKILRPVEPGTRFWRDADGNVCSKIGDDGGDVSPFVGAIRNGSLKQRPVEPVGQKTVTELSEEPIPHLGEMVFGPPKKKNEPVEKPQLPEEICDKIIRLESRLAARDAEIKELKKDIEANDIILEGSIDADNIIINAKNKEIAALGAENERLSRWRSRVYRRLTRYTQSLGLKLDISNIDWKKAP
jgi:hypothetical protein